MIRQNVKIICNAQGRQLSDIASALHVTRQSLHRFLTGSPTLDTIERIATVLGVPAFVLLHPAPLTALRQFRTPAPEIRTEEGRPAVFCCPICGTTFAPVPTSNQAPRPADDPSPAACPDQQQPDEANKPRKRGRPRKKAPEEMKLF